MPKVTEYETSFDHGHSKKTLKCVHDELECFGPYVKKLHLTEEALLNRKSNVNVR